MRAWIVGNFANAYIEAVARGIDKTLLNIMLALILIVAVFVMIAIGKRLWRKYEGLFIPLLLSYSTWLTYVHFWTK